MKRYDVVVIGTGTAGSTVAHKCNSAGKNVAIIDHRPFGGTCPLRGCDPKKVLVGGAELIDWNNRMKEITGLERDTIINWTSLISFKRTFTQAFPDMIEKNFTSHGIDAYHGLACFSDEKTIEVGDDQIEGDYIVIATGSKPRELNIPGEEHIITSDEFMELENLPDNIVFLGGGYISFEFANIAARAGSKPLILQRGEQPLKTFDSDMVDVAVEASKDAGIDVLTGHKVTTIEKKGNHYEVTTENGEQNTFTTDLVVHGGGRSANIDELGLDKGNVEVHKKGIAVNEYMQSPSNPRVYAAGDCTEEGPQLTPVAGLQGDTAAENIIKGNNKQVDYTGVPAVVFTLPPLASVGITKDDVKDIHEVIYNDRSNWYSSKRLNFNHAASKIIIDKQTDKILGAHILGPEAEEVINIFAMAMRYGLNASDVKNAVFTYPSVCSDIEHMM